MKPEELQQVSRFNKEHPLGKLLSEMKFWNFQVGDVLVRLRKNNDGTMHIDNVSDKCPVPKKYKVIHIDSLGIPWVKQLSVRGGLGTALYCLATHSPETYRYKVDPEQIDAVLLGFKYDPRSEYRKMRDSDPNYGGKHAPK